MVKLIFCSFVSVRTSLWSDCCVVVVAAGVIRKFAVFRHKSNEIDSQLKNVALARRSPLLQFTIKLIKGNLTIENGRKRKKHKETNTKTKRDSRLNDEIKIAQFSLNSPKTSPQPLCFSCVVIVARDGRRKNIQSRFFFCSIVSFNSQSQKSETFNKIA